MCINRSWGKYICSKYSGAEVVPLLRCVNFSTVESDWFELLDYNHS